MLILKQQKHNSLAEVGGSELLLRRGWAEELGPHQLEVPLPTLPLPLRPRYSGATVLLSQPIGAWQRHSHPVRLLTWFCSLQLVHIPLSPARFLLPVLKSPFQFPKEFKCYRTWQAISGWNHKTTTVANSGSSQSRVTVKKGNNSDVNG